MKRRNLLFCTDGYKPSHPRQYPPDMTGMLQYMEARSQKENADYAVWFGLQSIIQEYLTEPITRGDIAEAVAFYREYGVPFDASPWENVVDTHDGYLPVRIRAAPEGLVIPNGNVLMTVESTDPLFPAAGSFLETLLMRVWYPTTVATRSYQAKLIIKAALEKTADDTSGLPFKLHDFGARGVSSGESASIGGMAHLINFSGSDTVEGIMAAIDYYGDFNGALPGYSIPASEHSSMTAWGLDVEGETAAYDNMLTVFGPNGIFACVSDAKNIYDACRNIWGGTLRQKVIDSGATVVIRPDSGVANLVVPTLARILDEQFGSKLNSKGYKVLNHVRLIWGDGLDGSHEIAKVLEALTSIGFSADNIAFGMGGGLLQKCNRDTLSFAMKCSAARINGEWRDVYKDPIDGGKTSKKGRVTLVNDSGTYKTVTENLAWVDGCVGVLQDVYLNGVQFNKTTLSQVRNNTGLW